MVVLLTNPNYEVVSKQYQLLRSISVNDMDKKTELPIHLIFGTNDFTKRKVQEMLRVRQLGETVTELTRSGLVLMSSGKEAELKNFLCT